MAARDVGRIEALLACVPKNPSAAKLYGDVFERAALNLLLKGGSFPRFDLTAGKEAGSLDLKQSAAVVFATAPDLAASVRARDAAALAAAVFVPKAANYTGVDAVLGAGKALVNFTINLQHDLKLCNAAGTEGAVPVARALGVGDAEEIAFYWALPRERYEAACKARKSFRVISPPGAAGALMRRRIRQYALLVPFELRGRSEAAAVMK